MDARFSLVGALPLMFAGIGTWADGHERVERTNHHVLHSIGIFTPYLLLLLALLAVIDAFVDFRTRARQEPPEDEDQ